MKETNDRMTAAVHSEDLCIISDIITPIAFNLSFKMQREILTKFHLNILRCACDCAQIFVRAMKWVEVGVNILLVATTIASLA